MHPKSHPQKRPQITQPADPSYRLIALTRGQVAMVDRSDYDWLNQWPWYAIWNSVTKSYYAYRDEITANGKKKIAMARLIMQAPTGVLVDHGFAHKPCYAHKSLILPKK